MLRLPSSPKLLSICLLACASYANAQQTPSAAPPKLERIEEGSDTPITVTPQTRNQNKIVEKKEGGRVTEVQVKSGGSTYTMKPNVPAGNAQPGDGQSSAIRAPQWEIMQFNLGQKKRTEPREDDTPAAPVPPPPPPASK